jgi:acyl-coenzyme A thioesterase 13
MGSPLAAAAFLRYSTTRERDGHPRSFDTASLKGIFDIRAQPGRLQCKLAVTPEKQNRMGNLHGGCTATIIDVVGTAALLTVSPRGGVSLNINANYLHGMPGGDPSSPNVVIIDARVARVGRSIAVVGVKVYDAASGKLCASGQHVKFISQSEPDVGHLAKRVQGDEPLPPVSTEELQRGERFVVDDVAAMDGCGGDAVRERTRRAAAAAKL